MTIGSPLIATPLVTLTTEEDGEVVTVNVKVTDAAGMPAKLKIMQDGSPVRPDPPGVVVLDAKGTLVHTGAMAYG